MPRDVLERIATLRACAVAVVLLMAFSAASYANANPARSGYLATTAAGISCSESRGAFYFMTFDVLKSSNQKMYVVVHYDNPEDRKAPLVDELYLPPGARILELQSPSSRVVKDDSRYSAEIRLLADAADGSVGHMLPLRACPVGMAVVRGAHVEHLGLPEALGQ